MKTILIIAITLLLSIEAYCCSCMQPSTYCASIQQEDADIVILAYKVMDMQHGMKIKVVQVLDGTETRDTLHVWGDNGALCRLATAYFAINDTLVFGLHNCDLNGNLLGGSTLEQTDDYHISACGIYWLGYSKGMVSGNIDNGLYSLSLNAFKQHHLGCIPVGVEDHDFSIKLYPNPLSTSTTLDIPSYKPYTLSIYDVLGNKLREEQVSGVTNIERGDLRSGLYIIELRSENKTYVCKLMVE
jgi:hypothetical protein